MLPHVLDDDRADGVVGDDDIVCPFPKISISSVNCNSLNMSSVTKTLHLRKIYGIVKLKTDIILLSDIRLCNKSGESDLKSLANTLKINPYCSYNITHNSRKNSRGVAILTKSNLDFSVLQKEDDEDNNLILVKARINNHTVIIGSIYGPNGTDDNFFRTLRNKLDALGDYPVVMGGDWNCVNSTLPLASNPDVMNMINLPNAPNGKSLEKLRNEKKLIDPFRLLWPERIDFSYVPRDSTKTNRSRLDFFLISKSIATKVTECDIKLAVQSKLFDHKAISLSFLNKKVPVSLPTISGKILLDPDLPLAVEISAIETYISYKANFSAADREAALRQIGTCRLLLREAGPDPVHTGGQLADNIADIDHRNNKLIRIRNSLNNLNLINFQNCELTIDDDEFLEILINNLRNDVISYQSFIANSMKANKKRITKRLETLKGNGYNDFNEISKLERELANINENELSFICEKNMIFENINSERITPYFLKVIKGNKTLSSLTSIRDERGNFFNNEMDQKQYIVQHYEKIYKKDPEEPESLEGYIENFLGPEILQNPVVQDSKLSVEEKGSLETPLTMEELNRALEGANGNSAPGIDGINTKFIKKFWYIFNIPLLRYAQCCFDKGELTRSFRTAIFKMIPKKGDCSDINKWRPISLLSCTYKIISRAINNRLKLVVNRFTTRAQKGFTGHRYIQEVLINVLETISYCKKNNVRGAIVSIDQSKAFDTISHKYCTEVFKFFGFGENFIRMMDTIGTGRTATIMFDDGSLSTEIKLGRCRPQGDAPSPVQYNMAEGILLLKIELDPEIASVYQHMLAPNFTMEFNPSRKLKAIEKEYEEHLSKEKKRNTDKANAFADDTTVATQATVASLTSLKNILADFAKFSG